MSKLSSAEITLRSEFVKVETERITKLREGAGFCKREARGIKISSSMVEKFDIIADPNGGIMRATNPQTESARFAVVIVTTDERVSPEAETYLAGDHDLLMLQTWDELLALIKKQPPDAILLDIDTVGEHSKDGITALANSARWNRIWFW